MKFRKRPVVIDAVRWTGQNADEVKAFVGQQPGSGEDGFQLPDGAAQDWDQAHVWAEAEGCWMRCPVGHWVIRGVAGEFYPHDPDTLTPAGAQSLSPLLDLTHRRVLLLNPDFRGTRYRRGRREPPIVG